MVWAVERPVVMPVSLIPKNPWFVVLAASLRQETASVLLQDGNGGDDNAEVGRFVS